MREKRVEQYLVEQVRANKGICRKWVCPGYRGAPDRIVMFPGSLICFVELKRPKGGRLTVQQAAFHYTLRKMGFAVRVLKNKAEVDLFISDITKAKLVAVYGSSLLKHGVIEYIEVPNGF